MQKRKIQKHSPVVNAISHHMFSEMQNYTLASILRPGRFFVLFIYYFSLLLHIQQEKLIK